MRRCLIPFTLAAVALLNGCGGGGGGGSSSTNSTSATTVVLHIVTSTSNLPGAVQGKSYSTTMTAGGGQAPYHWKLNQPSNGIPGLSLDANSGTLSGTPTDTGFFQLTIGLSDSGSPGQTVSINMNLTVSLPIQATAISPLIFYEYSGASLQPLQVQAGVPPYTYSISGALPRGVKFDGKYGSITGAALVQGIFALSATVSDSFTPPETATVPITLIVSPPLFSLAPSLPQRLAVNQPFSGKLAAVGGVPPYSFSLSSGSSLPPGLSLDPSSGDVSGTPTTAGSYGFVATATDSNTPPSHVTESYWVTVATPLGRNDTVATATTIGNGTTNASISPYEDPPASAPLAADRDYYKIVAQGGQLVQLKTATARSFNGATPLDTVLEVLDANSNLLNTCGPPLSNTVTSVCVDDDDGYSTDSAIQVQVPGAANTTSAIYVGVLDWRGDARPDMPYTLSVSGALDPLRLQNSAGTLYAVVGKGGTLWTFSAAGGGVPYTWSVTSGSLPPGLSLDASSGVLSGTPTTTGSYTFTVQLTDMLSQTLPQNVTVIVVAPLSLTSTGPLPDATAGQQYAYQFLSSGGAPPLYWSLGANPFLYGIGVDPTGLMSGVAQQAGVYTLTVGIFDRAGQHVQQNFTLTVHPASSLTIQGNGSLYGHVGFTVYGSVSALYGTPPYTFAVSSGALPPGVTLSPNGVFTGSPSSSGNYVFTVSATDSSNPRISGTGSFTFVVN